MGGRGFIMAKKLYVGNLSYGTSEETLKNYFAGFGTVVSAKIISDRETGNSKGFGFVEMGSDEEAAKAIQETNGKELEGRALRVNEALDKPRAPRRDYGDRGGSWN
jgi:RNA recognition motif-containing protein